MNEKQCNSCKVLKCIEAFHIKSDMCKQCKKDWRVSSPEVLARSVYRSFPSRAVKKAYKKTTVTLEDFMEWSLASNLPDLLFKYKASGLLLKLRPEIDRLDPFGPYELYNVQWLTHEEHLAKTAIERNANATKRNIYTITGDLVGCLTETDALNEYGMTNFGKSHLPSMGLYWKMPNQAMILAAKIKSLETAVKFGSVLTETHIQADNDIGLKCSRLRLERPTKPFVVKYKGSKSFASKQEAITHLLRKLNERN